MKREGHECRPPKPHSSACCQRPCVARPHSRCAAVRLGPGGGFQAFSHVVALLSERQTQQRARVGGRRNLHGDTASMLDQAAAVRAYVHKQTISTTPLMVELHGFVMPDGKAVTSDQIQFLVERQMQMRIEIALSSGLTWLWLSEPHAKEDVLLLSQAAGHTERLRSTVPLLDRSCSSASSYRGPASTCRVRSLSFRRRLPTPDILDASKSGPRP